LLLRQRAGVEQALEVAQPRHDVDRRGRRRRRGLRLPGRAGLGPLPHPHGSAEHPRPHEPPRSEQHAAMIPSPRVTRHHPLGVPALSEALPLALAAAVYPPALLVLLLLTGGPRPRPLVGAYFVGAALVTAGVGLIGLAAADGAHVTVQRSRHAS